MPASRRLDRIHVADEVRDGDVGRGELLDVALVAAQPRDWRRVATLAEHLPRVLRDRGEGIVVHLAAGDDRDPLVEQPRQLAQDAALGLAAKTEQDEMVPREQRVDDLGDDGVLVADDAGEERLPRGEARDQVGADLVPDRPPAQGRFGPAAVLEVTESAWLGHVESRSR